MKNFILICMTIILSLSTNSEALRIGQHFDRTRLVFDLSSTIKFTQTYQSDGLSIKLSVSLPTEDRTVQTKGGPILIRVKNSTIRITGNKAKYEIFTLPPQAEEGHRLVIDVRPKNALRYPAASVIFGKPCPNISQGSEQVAVSPPPGITGVVGFYAAVIDPETLEPKRFAALNPNRVFPLASAYKSLVMWQLLRDVDAGRIKLSQKLQTTEALRSIEFYSPGINSIAYLMRRSIEESENTAADILFHQVGPQRVQDLVDSTSVCNTSVLLTTKAFWALQTGMIPGFPLSNLLNKTQAYFSLVPTEKRAKAAEILGASLDVNADKLLRAIDDFVVSSSYRPEIDTYVQNNSTPREFAHVLANAFRRSGLSDTSLTRFRTEMNRGCCFPKKSSQTPLTYWGGKAGSGWRHLTSTGYLETQGGQIVVYAYMNQESDVTNSEVLEKQLPIVAKWVDSVISRLTNEVR